jgi:phosphopantothenoylcysteine decarboxylase / phosphopantothenate---cysteine ligase
MIDNPITGNVMSNFYLRNPQISCVAKGYTFLFIQGGQVVCEIEQADVDGLSEILQELSLPASEEKTTALIEAEALSVLLESRILLTGTEEALAVYLPSEQNDAMPCPRLIFGVTGAVASMHTSSLLLELYHSFAEKIDVICTEAAHHFTQPEVLSSLGINVWSNAFEPKGEIHVPHIHLATKASLVVVFPASAHTLYKLAHGACSDLLSLTITATRAPVVLIPAMNDVMWSQPAIKRNVQQLRRDGFYVVEPTLGVESVKKRGGFRDYGNADVAGSFSMLLRGIWSHHQRKK